LSNPYFNPNNEPQDGARGIAAIVRNVFTLISQGFDKLPTLAGLWGGSANYGADSGAADAYVVSISPTYLTSYSDGLTIRVKIANANTGASTINVNALGATTIVRGDGSALQAGDLSAGQIVELTYNSTAGNFQLNASAAAASASAAAASAAAAAGSASAASTSAGTATTQAGIATTQAGLAAASAAASAASAVDASNYAAALAGTSTSSVLIGLGAKSFTASTGKQWAATQFLQIGSQANANNFMHGTVTSYNSGTGALVMNITDIGGTGTFADWSINVAGTQGPAGGVGGNATSALNLLKGSAVASATTPDIWQSTSGNLMHITGTTTTTGFAAAPQAGSDRWLIADGAWPLTNGANLILPGSANYTCSAGDILHVIADTTTQFRVTIYKANGQSVVGPRLYATYASTSTNLDITIGTGARYDIEIVTMDFATAGIPQVYTSTDGGSTFANSAGNYNYAGNLSAPTANAGFGSGLGGGITTAIQLSDTNVSNTTSHGGLSGTLQVFSPSDTTRNKKFQFTGTMGQGATVVYNLTCAGARNATAAINAIRITGSGGGNLTYVVRVWEIV
jgi:hypothetical protein